MLFRAADACPVATINKMQPRKHHRRQTERVHEARQTEACCARCQGLPVTSAANGDAAASEVLLSVLAGAGSAGCFMAAAAKGDCHGDAVPTSTDGGPGAAASMHSHNQPHDNRVKCCTGGTNAALAYVRDLCREHTECGITSDGSQDQQHQRLKSYKRTRDQNAEALSQRLIHAHCYRPPLHPTFERLWSSILCEVRHDV